MGINIEIDMDRIRTYQIHFEILCYGGKIFSTYFVSMMKWANFATVHGLKWSFNVMSSESLVTRARNTAAANFLTNKDATHLVFIDVDEGFEPLDIMLLLHRDKEVITAPVALKTIPIMYNINPLHKNQQIPEDGLIQVSRAGTGCMIIKRHIFEELKALPEVEKYTNDIPGITIEIDGDQFYSFFNTPVLEDENGVRRFMSEDYDFCEKVKRLGYPIWCDTNIKISHMGMLEYSEPHLNVITENIKQRYNLKFA